MGSSPGLVTHPDFDKYLMRLKDIKEGYDKDHKCMTPGSEYSSTISGDKVSMSVKLPFEIELSKKETGDLEADLHYAFEKVLSRYFD